MKCVALGGAFFEAKDRQGTACVEKFIEGGVAERVTGAGELEENFRMWENVGAQQAQLVEGDAGLDMRGMQAGDQFVVGRPFRRSCRSQCAAVFVHASSS